MIIKLPHSLASNVAREAKRKLNRTGRRIATEKQHNEKERRK